MNGSETGSVSSFEINPVIVAQGLLIIDVKGQKEFLKLKLKNTIEKTIIACEVNILCFNIAREPIDEDVSTSYIEIYVNKGFAFGDNNQILLPRFTRYVDIIIKRVAFSDGTVWVNIENKKAEPIEKIKNIKLEDMEAESQRTSSSGRSHDTDIQSMESEYNARKAEKINNAINVVGIICSFIFVLMCILILIETYNGRGDYHRLPTSDVSTPAIITFIIAFIVQLKTGRNWGVWLIIISCAISFLLLFVFKGSIRELVDFVGNGTREKDLLQSYQDAANKYANKMLWYMGIATILGLILDMIGRARIKKE